MEIQELTTLLGTFKTDIMKAIDDKVKVQSDAANKDIAELRTSLVTAEKALADLQEQSKKSFGMPGVTDGKEKKFDWDKFFGGLYRDHKARKGELDMGAAKRFWDTVASFEARVCRDYTAQVEKDFTAGDGSSGGFLVPPQIYQGDIVDTVYANTAILKLPVLKLTGLRADMPIPVDNANLTAYHIGENAAPTKTNGSFGLKWLRPKKIGVFTAVSNRLLSETGNSIGSIVKNKMGLDAAVELSRGLTNGIGAASEPAGLLSEYANMTGTGNLATNGARFTIDDLMKLKQLLAAANELRDTNTNGAIMRPEVLFGMLRERTEMYSGQAAKKGQPYAGLLNRQADIEAAVGLKLEATTQIPTGTVGSSTTSSKVVVGDFSKFAFATFRDPIFKVSDVASDASSNSAFLLDMSYMVMFLEYDCVVLRPTAFCAKDGAETRESSW